jgi:hypothetical protein
MLSADKGVCDLFEDCMRIKVDGMVFMVLLGLRTIDK